MYKFIRLREQIKKINQTLYSWRETKNNKQLNHIYDIGQIQITFFQSSLILIISKIVYLQGAQAKLDFTTVSSSVTGQSQQPSLFGNNDQNKPQSFFGAPVPQGDNKVGAFGQSPTKPISAFGQPAAQPSLFGSAPVGGGLSLFGQPNANQPNQSPAKPTSGLFGSNNAQPGGFGTFGQPAQTPSLFGSQPSQNTGSLFGNQPQQQQQPFSMFGQTAQQPQFQQQQPQMPEMIKLGVYSQSFDCLKTLAQYQQLQTKTKISENNFEARITVAELTEEEKRSVEQLTKRFERQEINRKETSQAIITLGSNMDMLKERLESSARSIQTHSQQSLSTRYKIQSIQNDLKQVSDQREMLAKAIITFQLNSSENNMIPLEFFGNLLKEHTRIVDILKKKIEDAEFQVTQQYETAQGGSKEDNLSAKAKMVEICRLIYAKQIQLGASLSEIDAKTRDLKDQVIDKIRQKHPYVSREEVELQFQMFDQKDNSGALKNLQQQQKSSQLSKEFLQALQFESKKPQPNPNQVETQKPQSLVQILQSAINKKIESSQLSNQPEDGFSLNQAGKKRSFREYFVDTPTQGSFEKAYLERLKQVRESNHKDVKTLNYENLKKRDVKNVLLKNQHFWLDRLQNTQGQGGFDPYQQKRVFMQERQAKDQVAHGYKFYQWRKSNINPL